VTVSIAVLDAAWEAGGKSQTVKANRRDQTHGGQAMSKRIVVGYDGTGQANDALHLGAALARAVDAHLLVASAIEFGPFEGTGPLGGRAYREIDPAGYDEVKAEYFDRIFAQAQAELGGGQFERHPLQDNAARGLTELAETLEADLVVIGSTHHGPIRRVVAGTVAGRLLHGAPCAVAIAPRGWSERRHSRLGLIGVGYDGSDESKLAVARAEELAGAFGATLRVITIAPYIGDEAHLGVLEVMRGEVWTERLREGAASISGDVDTERILRQGNAATELALQGTGLDLLVVGSRGYGPLRRALAGSVSGALVKTAPCPVMVVPRGVDTRPQAEVDAGAAIG
jgi:nucleotide-binding universal stress UspA family protein